MSTDDELAPEAVEDDTESTPLDVETVGVDEIVRQERVRSIFEARKTCREKRLEAKEEQNPALYRDAVEGYIREVEALFQQTEEGKEYWTTHPFGVFELTPHASDLPEKYDKIESVYDQKEVEFEGLESLFEAADPVRAPAEVLVPTAGRNRGNHKETVVIARHVPFDILDAMFSVVNTYLSDLGFGIEIDEAQKNTKLDDDLMEEVEQWRRENL